MSVSPFLLLFLGFQVFLVDAKIVKPCDVAEVMMKLGEKKARVSNWVCLAKYVSGFNTMAVNGPFPDDSHDFGIFQINDKYCKLGTKQSCGVSCTDLVSDNILESAKCALNIYQKEGFQHWSHWKNNCKNIDTSRFISKCSLKRSLSDILMLEED